MISPYLHYCMSASLSIFSFPVFSLSYHSLFLYIIEILYFPFPLMLTLSCFSIFGLYPHVFLFLHFAISLWPLSPFCVLSCFFLCIYAFLALYFSSPMFSLLFALFSFYPPAPLFKLYSICLSHSLLHFISSIHLFVFSPIFYSHFCNFCTLNSPSLSLSQILDFLRIFRAQY